jgi:hypothetical protein
MNEEYDYEKSETFNIVNGADILLASPFNFYGTASKLNVD